ncbi:MAG: bifunctional hydroxymethylpyrimidine kinase/phosphomethylpyrimidine kinase, partial [Oscillospiraceae bacterium]|nr:bifunctional hydroxymethylpyrimidine kinase/phosphomethylpyrimidine kinase [Oscillospiraceae bacterium]
SVLVKGGHALSEANDALFTGGEVFWLRGRRIDNPNTHGTGCTLSSAIASHLALGKPLPEAVRAAKEYLTGALAAELDLGRGSGPLDHGYVLRRA